MKIKKILRKQAETSLQKYDDESLLESERKKVKANSRAGLKKMMICIATFCIVCVVVIPTVCVTISSQADDGQGFFGVGDGTPRVVSFDSIKNDLSSVVRINDIGFLYTIQNYYSSPENTLFYYLTYNNEKDVAENQDSVSEYAVVESFTVFIYPNSDFYLAYWYPNLANKIVNVDGKFYMYNESIIFENEVYDFQYRSYITCGKVKIRIEYNCASYSEDGSRFFYWLGEFFK